MDARVPFSAYHGAVMAEWIDYNGHMNVAHYVAAFDQATDCFLHNLNMGPDYVAATRHSAFVVDMNVSYRRELRLADPFYITTQLLDYDAKKLRFFHQMFHEQEGFLVATNELLLLHVDLGVRRSSPFPAQVVASLQQMARQHRSLELPEGVGRVLSL